MNHFYRALTFLLCLVAFNSWANTPPIEDFFTLCADRTASNTTLCMDGNSQGVQYGGYILFEGLENHYKLENGKFQESQDGTAKLTGLWVNRGRSDVKFDVDITFSGRTTTAPNAPKEHHCFDNVDTNSFYYYTNTSGTLTGKDKVNGAKFEVSKFGPAMQVGVGANVTNTDLNFGASGWLTIQMLSQSSTSLKLTLQTSSAGGNGDININLSGNGSACFDSDISFNCLDDITKTAAFGQNGVAVSWNAPTATTTCMIGGGSNCASNSISGFVYMGKKNGSKYYCSETLETYTRARTLALAAGGHLAVVCSSTENDYIQSKIDSRVDVVWIGYSDEITEGTFKWTNGESCSYTKWVSGEPNDEHNTSHFSGADHAVLRQSDGKWLDRNKGEKYEFVMEIPCEDVMEPGNVTVTQIDGPTSGSVIPVGMTTIKYKATDECGNSEICEFKITVNEPVDPCAGNGSPIAEVEGQDSDCGLNNGKIKFTFADNSGRTNIEFSLDGGQTFPLNVGDDAGMAMFSDLAPGTYNLFVRWGNDDCPKSLGSIILEEDRQTPGMVCDDNDATTLNDVIQDDGCTCAGVPVGEIDLVCEDDITITASPGEDGIIVTFDEPTANTTCALGGLNVQQTAGPVSGTLFPVGMTTVTYTVTDACGNSEECSFKITVEETPLMLDVLCAEDIVVTEEVGDDGAVVTFSNPSIETNCPNDFINVSIIEGLESGSTFPVGTTEVTFLVEDGCNQRKTCSFLVTVNPAPTGDIDFVCNDDITVTAAVGDNSAAVTYTEPTASTTCTLGGLNVQRTTGLASGSTFPVGTTTVVYTATDACQGLETCTFTITVNPAPTGDIDFVCNDDITVTVAVGDNSAAVTYAEPTASTTCTLGGLNVQRTTGLASGSTFPVGTSTVSYTAIDACGESDICTFTITVNPAPTGDIDFVCNDDITVTAAVGDNSAAVTYTEPTASTTCTLGGLNVQRTTGLASGSTFPVGTSTVSYTATDACGESDICTFTITVNPAPTGDIDFVCNDDITISAAPGATSAVVTYTEPTASTTCPLGGLNVVLIEGLASGSEFSVGTSIVTYMASDACGGVENCSFKVIVEPTDALKGSVGDFVFFDNNGNGVQDADDVGVDGITVKLQDTNGNTLSTTETTSGGFYSFQNVEAGDYKIMVNTPDGINLSPANQGGNDDKDSDILADGMTAEFTLAAGQDIDNLDAGLVRPIVTEKAKVGDFVFRDNNGNGLQDDGEPGVAGVSVVLYDAAGTVKGYMVTGADGMYMFGDLEPGDYRVKFVGQPSDLTVTGQDAGNDALDSDIDLLGLTDLITLAAGEYNETIDAGFRPRNVEPDPARIGNQVFQDLNGNSKKDSSEPGIEGVTVKLLAANGDELQTTTTGQNGMYSFAVTAGSYIVMFNTPDNFNPANQSGNATDGVDNDSDSDPTTGMTEVFTVVAGESNSTIDAGFTAQTEPCDNITNGGNIAADENPDACGPYDAAEIVSMVPASGGSGDIEYIWLASTVECPTELTDLIPGATSETYDPGVLAQTTYFVRCARRVGCTVWIESDCVVKTVDACEPGGPVNCDEVTVTIDAGKVTVNGLNAKTALVQIIGAPINWELRTVCGGDQPACGTSTMITDLPEGDYEIKVQLWGEDGSYCYGGIPITVTGGDPGCTVDGGTISTNDDITDLCVDDNEPSIVNFTAAGGSGTNSAWIVTDANGMILNPDAPSAINFEGAGAGACNVYYVRYDDISGLAANNNISDLAGCFDLSNRITVTRRENCDGGGEAQCEDVVVTTSAGKINISGLAATFVTVKVQDMDNGWGVIAECADCDEAVSFDLPEGNYNVVIYFYRGPWNDKYCTKNVQVNLTNDGPCTDADEDGVCFEDDCDDNDSSIGAKQAAGTSCDDGDSNTTNDQIQSDGCTCAGTTDPGKEICTVRDVFNTDNCQFNIVYGLYLKLEGYDEYYTVSDASFVEYADGTAEYTARAINNTTPGIKWDISAQFGQRTTLAEVAPKYHNCITVNTDDFYFYEQLSGVLTGVDDAAGAQMNIMRIGPAFQMGVGANITHKFFDFGGSGWFVGDLVSQPTNIAPFNVLAGAQGQNGDFNMNFSGDGTECIDGLDNSELDCANVEVSAGNGNITISGLTAPIEIVKVFNSDWAPIFECVGDCGPTIEVPATEGNYLVRVSFYTANWVGECDVEFPVTLGANGVSASSRTAPELNFNSYGVEREVALEWTTNTGYKNDKYIIEKSTDGETFEAIEEVANEETKGEFAYYKGLDATPALGENYYRVKQVYQDGTYDYTDIQVVNFNINLTELSVYPNPAQNELFINLEDYAGQTGSLQISNAYGQVVKVLAIDNIPAHAMKVDLNDFQNGLYHLSVGLENGQSITKKILVSKLY